MLPSRPMQFILHVAFPTNVIHFACCLPDQRHSFCMLPSRPMPFFLHAAFPTYAILFSCCLHDAKPLILKAGLQCYAIHFACFFFFNSFLLFIQFHDTDIVWITFMTS
jgi:hypothetical protein